jgi:hypothetical protein
MAALCGLSRAYLAPLIRVCFGYHAVVYHLFPHVVAFSLDPFYLCMLVSAAGLSQPALRIFDRGTRAVALAFFASVCTNDSGAH